MNSKRFKLESIFLHSLVNVLVRSARLHVSKMVRQRYIQYDVDNDDDARLL